MKRAEGVLVGRLHRKWWPAGGNGLGFIAGNDWHILISKMLLTHLIFVWNIFILLAEYNLPIHRIALFLHPFVILWLKRSVQHLMYSQEMTDKVTEPRNKNTFSWSTYIFAKCYIFGHLRKSSTQAVRTRTGVQLRQPSMSATSGRTTASYRVSTQVPLAPHEYQEDTLSRDIEKHVTRSGKKYSDILIEKYVSRCVARNQGAIPQTVTRSPRIQSHTASANRFVIGNEFKSRDFKNLFFQFSKKKWMKEMAGQREILSGVALIHILQDILNWGLWKKDDKICVAGFAGIKLEDVRGIRAPFLAIGGNHFFLNLIRGLIRSQLIISEW